MSSSMVDPLLEELWGSSTEGSEAMTGKLIAYHFHGKMTMAMAIKDRVKFDDELDSRYWHQLRRCGQLSKSSDLERAVHAAHLQNYGDDRMVRRL